jgi:predicted AlkP superfamily pyrophosphatase or phosphodiesterase
MKTARWNRFTLWLGLFVVLGALVVLSLPAQESVTAPSLVLVLGIDQMRFDYLERFDDLYEGGLRTLIDEGALFTNARYRHAVTETGPGYSVILSGRHPKSSGIVGNAWFDTLIGRSVNVVDDPSAAADGRRLRPTSSVSPSATCSSGRAPRPRSFRFR